ncbi:unnamed protein product [Amoebophrya sp. A120]|nr:unnamed protein product [Amoebophrya sp. A120]|eukprot:GSA120T00007929001.1
MDAVVAQFPAGRIDQHVLLAGAGGCSAAFAAVLWMTGWREKPASYWYLGVALTASTLELGLLFYPSLVPLEGAGGNKSQLRHWQLELLAFSVIWCIMMSICVVDSLLYMPLDIYKHLRKGEKIPAYFYQVYYHHFLGIAGMLPPLFLFQQLNGLPLSEVPSVDSGNEVQARLLSDIHFCNRFVFLAEFSTIFLHIRNLLRLHATETGKPTPAVLRIGMGLAFAFAFLLCRILPTAHGLLRSIHAFSPELVDKYVYNSSPAVQPISTSIAACYIGFSFLNAYWGREIVKGIAKTFGAKKDKQMSGEKAKAA